MSLFSTDKICIERQTDARPPTKFGHTFRRLDRALTGWRIGVKGCAIATFTVFIINLAMTGWVAMNYSTNGGEHILYQGNCGVAAKLNTILHLLINALSTILLGSCNYCMQCLSAPTREELDKAHSKGKWLHIGILSARNLANISWTRVLLWCILGISTVPIHLL